jgi:hypothetical protein
MEIRGAKICIFNYYFLRTNLLEELIVLPLLTVAYLMGNYTCVYAHKLLPLDESIFHCQLYFSQLFEVIFGVNFADVCRDAEDEEILKRNGCSDRLLKAAFVDSLELGYILMFRSNNFALIIEEKPAEF